MEHSFICTWDMSRSNINREDEKRSLIIEQWWSQSWFWIIILTIWWERWKGRGGRGGWLERYLGLVGPAICWVARRPSVWHQIDPLNSSQRNYSAHCKTLQCISSAHHQAALHWRNTTLRCRAQSAKCKLGRRTLCTDPIGPVASWCWLSGRW